LDRFFCLHVLYNEMPHALSPFRTKKR
jgi:hypothetical protein